MSSRRNVWLLRRSSWASRMTDCSAWLIEQLLQEYPNADDPLGIWVAMTGQERQRFLDARKVEA
jgi:hypothetical protein